MIVAILSAAVLVAIWQESAAYTIEDGYLKGVAANTGIGNVLPLILDMLVTTGNATCSLELWSCPSCPEGNWIWIPESNEFKCVCLFGSYFSNSKCYRSNVTGCIEAKSKTECGLTVDAGTQFMEGVMSAFGITVSQSLISKLRPVDLLDTLLRFQTNFLRPPGISTTELESSLRWMKAILVSTPDNLLRTNFRNYEILQRIKMSVGFWQFPKVVWQNQDIFVNDQDMTSEMAAIINSLYGKSWSELGYAMAKFIAKVPPDYDLTLPVDDECPKTWWLCLNTTNQMVSFLQGILGGLNLNEYARQDLKEIIDLDDIDYLYLFYNKAMTTNLNGGYYAKDVQDAIESLFKAIKRLTDEDFDSDSVNEDVSMFKSIVKLFSAPKVSRYNSSYYINGIDIWGDFGKVYFSLEEGYFTDAGYATGKILLAMSTPLVPYMSVDPGNYTDDLKMNILANMYFRRVVNVFTNRDPLSDEKRQLEATIDEQCINESLDFSKKAILALRAGNWIAAVSQSVRMICQALDAAESCQDSFDFPKETEILCNILEGENLLSVAVDISKYVFEVLGINFFDKMVVAANSAFTAVEDAVTDLVSDAGDEISDVLTDIWDALKNGRVLSVVFIFIVVSVN